MAGPRGEDLGVRLECPICGLSHLGTGEPCPRMESLVEVGRRWRTRRRADPVRVAVLAAMAVASLAIWGAVGFCGIKIWPGG